MANTYRQVIIKCVSVVKSREAVSEIYAANVGRYKDTGNQC